MGLTKVAFIINGTEDGAMGQRARAFAERLANHYDVQLAYRTSQKIGSIFRFFTFLLRLRPQVSYIFDMGYSGVLGASLYKLLSRNRLVIETGDVIYELARASGMRGPLGLWLTQWLEWYSLRVADRIVVRGSFHKRRLAQQKVAADVIQDGVDIQQFKRMNVSSLRRQLGLDGVLTIGLVGSSIWSEKSEWCYGRELVEAIHLLKDKLIIGVMIGNGSGIERLKVLCEEYGISDRVHFWGYVPYGELPERLNLIDVCLSTQTNNLVGQVRTTGKLPLYLATGRYVLASDVGEAALVLPLEMRVLYAGDKDENYPQRLAEKITSLIEHPEELRRAADNAAIAQRHFNYDALAVKLACVIESVRQAPKLTAQSDRIEEETAGY